jgi:hypothetical protein
MKRRQVIQTSTLFATTFLTSVLLPVRKLMALSIDHQIHILNRSSEDIFVMPSPNPDWLWADVAFDVAFTGVVSLIPGGTAVGVTKAVDSLSKLQRLIQTLKWLLSAISSSRYVGYAKAGAAAGTWVGRGLLANKIDIAEAQKSAVQELENARVFLEKNGIRIKAGESTRVYKGSLKNPLRYLSPSGLSASVLESSNMSLFIINVSMSRSMNFNTNADHSWIVTNREVIRSKYGNIGEESRKDGAYRFSTGKSELYSGQSLERGEAMSSPNRKFNLVHQEDGNLVLHVVLDNYRELPIWQSNTKDVRDTELVMQEDGNLVLYDRSLEKPVWASGSNKDDNSLYKLMLQDDGNLVIRSGDEEATLVWANGCHQTSKADFQRQMDEQIRASRSGRGGNPVRIYSDKCNLL